MKSSIETEFNQTILWLIEEIEKDLITSQQKEIRFELKTNKNSPSLEDQRRAINFLEIKKAIEITSTQPFRYAARHSSVGIAIPEELNIQPLIYSLIINRPKFNAIFQKLSLASSKRSAPKHPLPDDCHWDNTTFHCGEKDKISFYDTKAYHYFKILTENHGSPVFNEDVYSDLGYENARDVATGVKRDLNRKLKKLLKTKTYPERRIAITPISSEPNLNLKKKKAGYILRID